MITKGHQGVRRWKVQFRWPHLFFCGIKSRFHFILLWNQWRISGHEWPSQIDYSQSSMVTAAINLKHWPQWMSTFWNCGKSMRNKEPNGIYPLKYLFHSDQIFRGLEYSKDLKGNPGCCAVVLEVFTTVLLPECSVEPWGEAHSEELLPYYWLASGDSPMWELLVWALEVAAMSLPWFIAWSRLRLSNRT